MHMKTFCFDMLVSVCFIAQSCKNLQALKDKCMYELNMARIAVLGLYAQTCQQMTVTS